METAVVQGANYICSMGTSPGVLFVTSQQALKIEGKMVATIKDSAPMSNISPCGMCTSSANPTVASATAAALGVLTPMPCIPSVSGMWTTAQTKLTVGGTPCLGINSQLICSYTGNLKITSPGQMKVIM